MTIPSWFEVHTYAELPSEFKQQIRLLKEKAFRQFDSEEERQENDDKFDSPIEDFLHILAVEDHQVICTLSLVKRILSWNGERIALGGIGGVVTRKDRRQRGLASTLLGLAMKQLHKAGCDIAYLCTDVKDPIKRGLYERVGFVIPSQGHTYLGKSGKRYTDTDGMLAPVRSRRIFENVLRDKQPFDIGVGNW